MPSSRRAIEAAQKPMPGRRRHCSPKTSCTLRTVDTRHSARGKPGGEGRRVHRGVDEVGVSRQGESPRQGEEGEQVPRGEGRRGHADHVDAPHGLPCGSARHASGEHGHVIPVGGQRARQFAEEGLRSAHVGREVLEDEEDARASGRGAARGGGTAHNVVGSSHAGRRRCREPGGGARDSPRNRPAQGAGRAGRPRCDWRGCATRGRHRGARWWPEGSGRGRARPRRTAWRPRESPRARILRARRRGACPPGRD